ncbi:uncharacterized protein LOC130980341 [Arachis stenosperma]|uniref:uncharacterized protein LOC130980341 n=1 Tax=Arachis stenosperma TaxID=217475 RepID=UPI0025AB7036|nr:uncharacterized protein LOC130980341 [Arachis stenosperma]
MPFGLKNAGATYQRLMNKVFDQHIGRNIEVYVDDMVAKTKIGESHIKDLAKIFGQIRAYNMRLNPEKCAFGVQGGKFLGFILTSRGIEANPKKCQAVLDMHSPTTIKESHTIKVRTSQPLRQILAKHELAGRLIKWSIELSEFDIQYQPRSSVKSQYLADFVAEFTGSGPNEDTENWVLFVDGASNPQGSGAGILLENPEGVIIEHSLRFSFRASNNQAEYEALIAGLSRSTGAEHKYDRQPSIRGYLAKAIYPIPQKCGTPLEVKDTKKFKRQASFFTLLNDELYRRGYSRPLLKCLNRSEAEIALAEVHEGIYGTHSGARSLARKILRAVEHPQSNGLAEVANKVLLQALRKKLDDAKGLWDELIPEILWGYNTSVHSTTKETPFHLVYGSDAMIPVEISQNSLRTQHEAHDDARRTELNLVEEVRAIAAIRQKALQQRIAQRHNKTVKPRSFHQGDLVLRKTETARKPPSHGKLAATWDGPYRIRQVIGKGAYHLEELDGTKLPNTWNVSSLKKYFS